MACRAASRRRSPASRRWPRRRRCSPGSRVRSRRARSTRRSPAMSAAASSTLTPTQVTLVGQDNPAIDPNSGVPACTNAITGFLGNCQVTFSHGERRRVRHRLVPLDVLDRGHHGRQRSVRRHRERRRDGTVGPGRPVVPVGQLHLHDRHRVRRSSSTAPTASAARRPRRSATSRWPWCRSRAPSRSASSARRSSSRRCVGAGTAWTGAERRHQPAAAARSRFRNANSVPNSAIRLPSAMSPTRSSTASRVKPASVASFVPRKMTSAISAQCSQ